MYARAFLACLGGAQRPTTPLAVARVFGLAADAVPARGDEARKPLEPKEARVEPPAPPKDAVSPPQRLSITLSDGKTAYCREQAAQSFLIRGNWFPHTNDADKV